ncbi:colicin immunity protein Cui [Enterobacter sp. UPMP2052]
MTEAESNKAANRMLYLFMATGIVPLLVVFALYLYNPGSPLLNDIASGTASLPAVTSRVNPLMTKVMDVYCKTAPFFAFVLFIFSFGKRKIITPYKRPPLIRACLFGPFFYFFYVYMLLFRDVELTTAGRPVKLMSGNDATLLLFYIGLYLSVFFMTYFILLVPVISCKLIKERR